MKILVLNGSPRAQGNTAAFAKTFAEGAEGNGNSVEIVNVAEMNVGGCRACEFCRKNGGVCAQQDDMQALYPKLKEADMIVFASPVYYMGFTGQLQNVITRFFAIGKLPVKQYALILSSGSPNVYEGVLGQYRSILAYFSAEDKGIFTFNGGKQKTEENLAQLRAFGAFL